MKKATLFSEKDLPGAKDYLWRYFDIHKFISLIQTNTIRFSRMDTFEDPLEGIPLRALLTYRTKLDPDLMEGISMSELILDPQLRDLVPPQLQAKLRSINAIQKSTFLTCWFAEQRESVAMWNLYSNTDGVAVKIPFGKLATKLRVAAEGVSAFYGGMVEYLDLNKLFILPSGNDVQQIKVALRKDHSFNHECEFRFVLRMKDHRNELSGIESAPLDFRQLGMKVVCHPRMSAWKRQNIKTLLSEYQLESAYQESTIVLR
jgi:hypothetical protein